MRTVWKPTAKDQHYRRTGEVTWDCTACCLDGHEAKAHDGGLTMSWDIEGQVQIVRADPCLLLDADFVEELTQGSILHPAFSPPSGVMDGDLLRLNGANRTVIYRLTKQPFNDRPEGATPSVAEFIPPYGDFYLAEWPD